LKVFREQRHNSNKPKVVSKVKFKIQIINQKHSLWQ